MKSWPDKKLRREKQEIRKLKIKIEEEEKKK
jgi:hypothetical protein